MSDNRSYIEDPNEKYEFLVRPLDGGRNAHDQITTALVK